MKKTPRRHWFAQVWEFVDSALFGSVEPTAQGRRQTGQRAEELAASYLQAKGYRLEGRNVRLGRGELDVIAWQGETLVVVEVKSGHASDGFLPRERVDRSKQRQLLKLTEAYRKQNRLLGQGVRIDIVEVVFGPEGKPQIEHFEGGVGQRPTTR